MRAARNSIKLLHSVLGGALLVMLCACTPSAHDLVASGKDSALRARLEATPFLVDSRDRLGKTPLHHAVTFNQIGLMPLLLEAGADINAQDKTGMTPLHGAALLGNADAAQWLLEAGAGVEARDAFGDTAAHTAAVFGRSSVLRVLMAYGADLRAGNAEDLTPLQLARHYGQEATAANILRLIMWSQGRSPAERREILDL